MYTGIYYTTPELHTFLESNKSKVRTMYKNNDIRVRNFVKV